LTARVRQRFPACGLIRANCVSSDPVVATFSRRRRRHRTVRTSNRWTPPCGGRRASASPWWTRRRSAERAAGVGGVGKFVSRSRVA